EEVFASIRFTRAELDLGNGIAIELVDRDRKNAVALEGTVFQRIGLVAGFVQVARSEGIGIDNQDAALFEIPQVRFEGRGIHGNKRIKLVAGRVDLMAAEMNLES